MQGEWDEVEAARFFKLFHNDRFKFGQSTRDYVLQNVDQCRLA